jgi:hypothetical protein
MDSVFITGLSEQTRRTALSPKRIAPALCREIIEKMMARCHADDFNTRFRIRIEWADLALSRPDSVKPPFDFTQQDFQFLHSIANSGFIA